MTGKSISQDDWCFLRGRGSQEMAARKSSWPMALFIKFIISMHLNPLYNHLIDVNRQTDPPRPGFQMEERI